MRHIIAILTIIAAILMGTLAPLSQGTGKADDEAYVAQVETLEHAQAGEFNDNIIIDNERAVRAPKVETSYVFPHDVTSEDVRVAENDATLPAQVRISILAKAGEVLEGERFIVGSGEMYSEGGMPIQGGTTGNMLEGIYYAHADGTLTWEAPLM